MTLAQTFRNLFSAPAMPMTATAKAPGGASSFDGVLSGMTRYGQFRHMETMDTGAAYKLAMVSPWVYSDIKLIADRVASSDASPCVHRRSDEEEIEDHPFLQLLDEPNPFMTGSFLKRYTTWWYMLRGNAYIFISTPAPGRGTPDALWPLDASMVRPLPETIRQGQGIFRRLELIDYEYNVNGKLERLPGENIIHFRMPNPFDWWEGLSQLTAAMLGVQMDHAQATWQRDFFAKENAIPSAIISVPATTSPVDFDRQRKILSQQMREGQKRLFTRSGDLTVETITQTLEQMQIIDSRKFNRDEIDRIFGIPEGLISGGLSGDSRLAAEIAFARNTVQPLIDYMAEQLSTDIAPYYGEDIMFKAPNVIPQDRALEVQEYTVYSQDMSVNENREARGMEPAKLPAELAELADVPVRLLQYVQAAKQPEPQPGNGQPQDPVDDSSPQELGDMAGAQSPDNMTDEQSGKAIAIDAELKRWRKVAIKAVRDGKPQRPFISAVIPFDRMTAIAEALQDAKDESEVKAAFEAAPFHFADDWANYP